MIRAGKFLLSGGLILASGAYAWWHHLNQHPVAFAARVTLPKPTPKTVTPASQAAAPAVAANTSPPVAAAPAPAEMPAPAEAPLKPAAPKHRTERTQTAPAPEPVAVAPAAPAEPLNAVTLAPSPAISTGRYQDGEFIGNAFDGEWGPVQVKVVVRNGDIADVICLEYPIHRARSAEISEWALPQLHEEVIKAQSEKIDWVTQASFTSENYQQSLASALDRAKKQP